MPYLTDESKLRLKENPIAQCGGDMNFQINIVLYNRYKVLHKEKVLYLKKGAPFPFPSKEIGKILKRYIDDKEVRYIRLNDCMGALMNAVFEFIRRNPLNLPGVLLERIGHVSYDFAASWYFLNCAKHEDKACFKNGDVFPKRKS